jgi:hypothetical protein
MSDTEPALLAAALASARTAPPAASWPRWRIAVIRIWAGLLTAQALLMAHGLVVIGSAGPHEHFMYASSTVWKLLSLGGVGVVMWTGGRSVAAYWALAVGQLVWFIDGVIRPEPNGNGLLLTLTNVAIFYGPLILFRPQRSDLVHPGFRPHPLLMTLALTGAVPLIVLAARLSRQLSGEIGFDMVGLYLALAATALLAALRPAGAAWLAPIVGLGAFGTGLAAIAFPHDFASPGLTGGGLLLATGLAFATLARRTQQKPPAPVQARTY